MGEGSGEEMLQFGERRSYIRRAYTSRNVGLVSPVTGPLPALSSALCVGSGDGNNVPCTMHKDTYILYFIFVLSLLLASVLWKQKIWKGG